MRRTKKIEIKPCPFCGDEGFHTYTDEDNPEHWVECSNEKCWAIGPSNCYSTKKEAIEAWNYRPIIEIKIDKEISINDLKSCPFCNGKVNILNICRNMKQKPSCDKYEIICSGCYVRINFDRSTHKMRKLWNTRINNE